MKEEKDKLRDFMQEVLRDYEVTPDPEDWNRIKKTLHKGKGKRFVMWTIGSVAASLLILFALYTGGIFNHSDIKTAQTVIGHYKAEKKAVTSSKNMKLSAYDASKTSSVKERTTTSQPSERIQQPNIKSVASSNILKNNNLTGLATNRIKQIRFKISSGKTFNISTVQPFDSLNAIAIQQSNIKAVASSNILKNNNLTGLATNRIKQIRFKISSGKTFNISTVQPSDSLNAIEIQYRNSLVHSIKSKQIELIKNKSMSLHYNWLDLLQNEPFKIIDYQANNVSSLKLKGLSLSNSSGLIMQAPTTVMSYSGAFASQLASNMYLNSVKVFDNSSLSSLNIGDLLQNKKRNFTPPLTFGLNINLSLNGKWSLETGIQYTKLQSKGEVTINSSNAIQFTTSFNYKVDECLNYLGVPIIINYNLFQKRKTSFYISTGLAIDKGIIAKYKATPEDNFPGMQSIYSHNSLKGLQYSVNSGIGISYIFIPHFELFAQPSVMYFFHPREKNVTIYSVHPWMFNLRSGIRYTLK